MENRRDFFRLDVYGVPVVILVTKEGIRDVMEGNIRDISGSGISFYLPKTVNIEANDHLWVDFTLQKIAFQCECAVIRTQIVDSRLLIACQFHEMKEKESAKISSVLLRLDAIRRQ